MSFSPLYSYWSFFLGWESYSLFTYFVEDYYNDTTSNIFVFILFYHIFFLHELPTLDLHFNIIEGILESIVNDDYKVIPNVPNKLLVSLNNAVLEDKIYETMYRNQAKMNRTRKPRDGSRTAATSKMEHFVIIVNVWNSLTIITKRTILDVAAVLDPPLKPLYLFLRSF